MQRQVDASPEVPERTAERSAALLGLCAAEQLRAMHGNTAPVAPHVALDAAVELLTLILKLLLRLLSLFLA